MATRLRNSLEFGLIMGGVKKKRDTRGNYEFTIRPVSFFLRSDRRSRKERKREEEEKEERKNGRITGPRGRSYPRRRGIGCLRTNVPGVLTDV